MDIKKTFKKGMTVILKSTDRGYTDCVGKKYIITAVYDTCISCRDIQSKRTGYTFYPNDGDEIVGSTRKEQAQFLRDRIADMKKQLLVMEKEAAELEMYETEEDFVAAKLDAIITAGNNKDPQKRISAIKDVIKTLKETHYL